MPGPALKRQKTAEELHMDRRSTIVLLTLEIVAMICYGLFTDYGFKAEGLGSYYPMFQDVHVMIFIGFGFLMTFMRRYGYSSVGFNFLLAVVTIQYSILVSGFFHCIFKGDFSHKIGLDVTALIMADFAAGAVLISFGAVLGKATVEQLVVMIAAEIVFYSLNESIGVEKYRAVDMGGSMYVHTFGAYFGLAVSFMLTRAKKVEDAGSRFGSSYESDLFSMIGTVFLWMYWPSFNGALAKDGEQHRVVVNTVLSLTNSCIAAFLLSKLLRPHHKLDMVDIQNASLAGGVAVGSSADLLIGPAGSLAIGLVAGCLSVVGYVYVSPFLERKIGLHDTCGVHNLHGMPGLLGGLAGAVSSGLAGSNIYGESLGNIFESVGKGERTSVVQAEFQFAALATTVGIAILSGLMTGKIMSCMRHVSEYGEDWQNWNHIAEEEKARTPMEENDIIHC
uniref:Ammonium transporter AmtB-like domain-containing protein n=1 Tax=Alexandrium catenella TaxID=2925 RepID=A0A7S1M0R2_ALECA|mmetsp:Transcript_1614/g.4426  ORF Transcript_1614/g.4426 Transcript_1614/m.4426 type:complete len:449 (+) Transcript_1614:82-1428(+)